MKHLYRFLLRLLPQGFREPFVREGTAPLDDEMTEVFLAAANDARARGRWSAWMFNVREAGGLMVQVFTQRTHLPQRALWLPGGAMLGLLAALIVIWVTGPEMFTSTAALQFTPPILVNAGWFQGPTLDSIIDSTNPTENVRIYRKEDKCIVEVRHSERFKAQALAQQQSATLLDTAIRESAGAVKNWKIILEAERKRSREGAHYEAVTRRYHTVLQMERALQFEPAALSLLEPASLPVRADLPHLELLLAGALWGACIGVAVSLIAPLERSKVASISGGRL